MNLGVDPEAGAGAGLVEGGEIDLESPVGPEGGPDPGRGAINPGVNPEEREIPTSDFDL